jgi:hypothetical protein
VSARLDGFRAGQAWDAEKDAPKYASEREYLEELARREEDEAREIRVAEAEKAEQ